MLVGSPTKSGNWVYPFGCLQSLPTWFCVCECENENFASLLACLGLGWLSAFLQCLLECPEMVWGFALSLPRSVVIDISDSCLPLSWLTESLVIAGARQGKEGNGNHIESVNSVAGPLPPFSQPRLNLRLWGVGTPGGECGSSKVPGTAGHQHCCHHQVWISVCTGSWQSNFWHCVSAILPAEILERQS